jgi:hypothetical protein
MVTSKPMVVYGQAWFVLGGDVGSGLKDRLNGWACGSDGWWRSGSTSSFDEGSRYPAWKGEVQGWWQGRHGLSYECLFC